MKNSCPRARQAGHDANSCATCRSYYQKVIRHDKDGDPYVPYGNEQDEDLVGFFIFVIAMAIIIAILYFGRNS